MTDLKRRIATSIFVTALVWPMLASAHYNESANGDLSGNFQNPTSIALVPNVPTTISGTIQGAGHGVRIHLDDSTLADPVVQVLLAHDLVPVTVVDDGGG